MFHSREIIVLSAIFSISACSSNDGSEGSGTLNLGLTDAPVEDAAEVWVEIPGVELRDKQGGQWTDYDFADGPVKVDLLTLQGENSTTLLDDTVITAGEYDIRLKVNTEGTLDSYLVLEGGAIHELNIPSGSETGLKPNKSIIIPANRIVNYTVDFDARKSLVQRGNDINNNGYALKPVLRIVDNSQVGSITGTIENTDLLVTGCSDSDPLTHNAVYIFEGANITPDDIDDNDAEPVTTANIDFDSESGVYHYTAGFLLAGDYTVSLTCKADLEDIDTDDELSFKATENVTVAVGDSGS